MVKIAAIFVGKPEQRRAPGGTLFTGGVKSAVDWAFLRFDGFDGDGQGNLTYHGGRDRTVCVYMAEHYAWWKSELGFDLRFGAMCENLTVEGLKEEEVCIGDLFKSGGALVQVSLPRDPCRALDVLTGVPGLFTRVQESGRCGFHMRTMQEGTMRAGGELQLVKRHPAGITVAAALDLYHGRSRDQELARRLSDMPEFAEQGKRDIARRLAS